METRQAERMVKVGDKPPGRTDELDAQLYHHWSEFAHNKRSSIIESYSIDQKRFVHGGEADTVACAIWVGYGTQVLCDVVNSIGLALCKLLGTFDFWQAAVEPAIEQMQTAELRQPLDPVSLGFDPAAE
jgi:hypothetical protein